MAVTINTKKNQLLNTAKALFWKYGLKRVSIEEICKTSGVSKMTFYRFFNNKQDIAKAVMDEVFGKGRADFRAIMIENSPAAEKIRKMIELKTEGTNNISHEFLQDFYSNPELGLKSYIEEKTRESWEESLQLFKKGQEKGWFRKDFKPEFLFLLSQKFIDMLSDQNVIKMYDSPQDIILEMTNLITYGISHRE